MKIAIVAPSPQPFIIGGAEKFWMGMYTGFNRYTQHACELFKIPVTENSFWNLIDSYRDFSMLDFSGFDMLISSKYPAWMCRHQNHVVYMLHTLRGLYDQYGMDKESSYSPKQNYVLELAENKQNTIEDIFEGLAFLREVEQDSPAFSFPGPFIRRIIHALDVRALQNTRKIYALSQTVANRHEYFPEGADVEVLYPPTTLRHFACKAFSYFFTASRFDVPKRLDLLIQAYLKANIQIPLKIAGTGPQEETLRRIANDDPRIEFLGFITDVQLLEHYANAYAVPFVPQQEDYGLITIEAMRSGKPVITCSDTGGVTEFVSDRTGYICEPTVDSLADGFRKAAADPVEVQKRGEQARESVQNITWKHTVLELSRHLPAQESAKTQRRKKVLSLSTYPIYPPRGGGQNRIFYLYKELAKEHDIELLTLSYSTTSRTQIAPGLWETQIAKTDACYEKEKECDALIGTGSGDILFLEHWKTVPEFVEAAQCIASSSDMLILEHPYCLPVAEQLGLPYIFSTHNVEYALKRNMYCSSSEVDVLLQRLEEAEKKAYQESVLNIFTCDADAKTFQSRFGERNTLVVDNGYDPDSVPCISPAQRIENRRRAGYDTPVALFMGSQHKPNLESVEYLLSIAPKMADFHFVIVGGAGYPFMDKQHPRNVTFTGIVDDATKAHWLSLADVAVNPMFTGSGTNLKVLDFMGSGIPVVTTPVGGRGHLVDSELYFIREIDAFPEAMRAALQLDPMPTASYARHFFGWPVLSQRYCEALRSVLK